MKNLFLFGAVAIMALGFTSCNDDEVSENVKNLVLTENVTSNVATLTATAENANTYSWDFGNGTTGDGASVEATYKFIGEYWVKCTASGKIDNLTDSILVKIDEGDPSIVNTVTELLASHPWKWAGDGTLPNDFGMWGSGAKSHVYTNDSAQYDYADEMDDSWWKLGEYDGVVTEDMLDDRYNFTLDKTLAYSCEYGDGIMFNWAWVNKYGYGTPSVWEDEPVDNVAKEGSWDFEIIVHDADTIAKTIVNGAEVAESYIITLSGNTWLGVGAASSIYQICRIDADTMWVRYDNTYPQDLPIKPEWAEEGIALDDPEWGYFYLVKAND